MEITTYLFFQAGRRAIIKLNIASKSQKVGEKVKIENEEVLKTRAKILDEVGEQLRQVDEQGYQLWREIALRQPEEVVAAQSFLFGKALAYAGALFCDSED